MKKAKSTKPILSFYDLKLKKKFNSGVYVITKRMVKGNARRFAVHTKANGKQCWRILPSK